MSDFLETEADTDEVLMFRNPKGGRPQRVGKRIFERGHAEASEVIEESHIRYLLGYCHCSRKIVIGEKRAQILMEALSRNHVQLKRERVPMRARIARILTKGL